MNLSITVLKIFEPKLDVFYEIGCSDVGDTAKVLLDPPSVIVLSEADAVV